GGDAGAPQATSTTGSMGAGGAATGGPGSTSNTGGASSTGGTSTAAGGRGAGGASGRTGGRGSTGGGLTDAGTAAACAGGNGRSARAQNRRAGRELLRRRLQPDRPLRVGRSISRGMSAVPHRLRRVPLLRVRCELVSQHVHLEGHRQVLHARHAAAKALGDRA